MNIWTTKEHAVNVEQHLQLLIIIHSSSLTIRQPSSCFGPQTHAFYAKLTIDIWPLFSFHISMMNQSLLIAFYAFFKLKFYV